MKKYRAQIDDFSIGIICTFYIANPIIILYTSYIEGKKMEVMRNAFINSCIDYDHGSEGSADL